MSSSSTTTTTVPALPPGSISRRRFLKMLGLGAGYSVLGPLLSACDNIPGERTPLTPPSREYTFLKRTSFGVHRDALAQIKGMGINAYLEQQLDYLNIDDGTLEADIAGLFPLTTQTPEQLIVGFPDNIATIAQQMISATQYRQVFSQRQLYEVMVEFWTDHFNIHLLNGLGPTLKPQDDRDVIRSHALGNFRDLLGASAQSPAMLFYLDNFYNLASAPNENYAREIMELHTLGVDGGYTENDIKEVARCFTGWTIRFPGDGTYGTFKFEPTIHDNDPKTVLGVDINAGGQADGERLLDLLANHASTARFIAAKLCRRFISDYPQASTINDVATAFSHSSGDIKTTLRALFNSAEFNSTYDQKITRPSEFLASMVRALAPDTNFPTDNGLLLYYAQSALGQVPYNWPTPDGYPDTESYWISTGGLLNRWRLSFFSYMPYIPEINVMTIDYAALLEGANTSGQIVDTMTNKILMRPLSALDRARMIAWLFTSFGIQEYDVIPNPADAEQGAALVAAVLISSAYFQVR